MPSAMPFARALVVANPISGRGRGGARARALADALEARGLEAELFLTAARGDAERRARALRPNGRADDGPRPDVVVVVGGDGTVAEVLAGLPTQIPLAIHPMGTANVLGRELALPRTVEGTLAMLFDGRRQELDVARVNGRLSFLVVGVGFDGAAVRDVERRRRGPITRWTYVAAVLRTLCTWSAPSLSVELEGQPVGRFGWVLVSNVAGYGGILRLWEGCRLDDGLYEVFLFEKATRWALVRYALAGFAGRLPGRGCRLVQARRIRIASATPVPYEVDGDFGGETPVEIEVTGERFQLILPASTR